MGEEAVLHCKSYALEAERKAGEALAQMPKAKNQYSANSTLLSAGINSTQSERWQQGARVPEEDFQERDRICDRSPRVI